jgi:PAS domain S-box-containing protein
MKPAASGAPPSQSSRMVTADSADRHIVEMEGRYRGLLEAAPDAMIVVNEAGKIVLLNLQAEKQFGYSRDELLGQRVTNVIPEGFAERLVGPTDWHGHRAHRIAQGWQRVPDRVDAEPDGQP